MVLCMVASFAYSQETGIVSGKILDAEMFNEPLLMASVSIENTDFSAVTAACICVKATSFAEVEGFSPIYVNGQEDIDLCLKLKRYTSLMAKVVTTSVLVHHESKSEGRFDNVKPNRHVFVKRWASYISSDDMNHYKDDGVLISSAKLDKSNIPFWIKSSTFEVKAKVNTETNSLVRQLYQKQFSAYEALSSLMFLFIDITFDDRNEADR